MLWADNKQPKNIQNLNRKLKRNREVTALFSFHILKEQSLHIFETVPMYSSVFFETESKQIVFRFEEKLTT